MPPEQIEKQIPSIFKTVFFCVLGITLLCLGIMVIFSCAYDPLTQSQSKVFEVCDFAFKAGIGAMFGLLGGKSTS